jgi:hypothetical protein
MDLDNLIRSIPALISLILILIRLKLITLSRVLAIYAASIYSNFWTWIRSNSSDQYLFSVFLIATVTSLWNVLMRDVPFCIRSRSRQLLIVCSIASESISLQGTACCFFRIQYSVVALIFYYSLQSSPIGGECLPWLKVNPNICCYGTS